MPLTGVTVTVASLAIVAYAAWWCGREWSRIWAEAATVRDRIVYHYGVRGFGLGMWVVISLGIPLGRVLRERPGTHAVLWLALSAVLMFPLCLWLGSWWGRVMAMLFRGR